MNIKTFNHHCIEHFQLVFTDPLKLVSALDNKFDLRRVARVTIFTIDINFKLITTYALRVKVQGS